jgi:hypothetical protein
MSILVRFKPKNLTTELYEEANSKIEDAGQADPDGRELHVFFGDEGSLAVSEVWDSQEAFEAFGETLMPILADVGIEAGEPEVQPVHNTRIR